jgi:hypothetical protein
VSVTASSIVRRPIIGATVWVVWALIVAIGVWSLIGGVGILILAGAGVVAALLIKRHIPGAIYGLATLAALGAWVWLAGR